MNAPEATPVRVEFAEGVAEVVLQRPAALNAFDRPMARAFLEACRALPRTAGLRAVLLHGEGKGFGAGGDLATLREGGEGAALELIEPLHEAVRILAALNAPVIAAVHGMASGGSLSLALACDLALAAEGTRFNLAYANVGANCDLGGSWHLPRLVGLRNALQIALLSETFDAAEALRLGLVQRVLPAEALLPEARALARRLAAGPTLAYGRMKRLLRESFERDLAAQLDAERDAFCASARTQDFHEAIDAFFAKRKPAFQGR